ncbi:hypothetical protein K461DRAFT_295907 [Myriangium duriaei CBS 260.36]|uniref:Large ribosomal subunit protein mL46 n=1 Tax=Myriangium duriaei CBS 260.36 TaxID=1168546 RepID=A0A9P4IVD7_9PEZI|nr:hypothetical protein K461DRAFT_295907 [Myriangium duriaei CBS 260.36]
MHATSRAARRVAVSSDRLTLDPVCLSCRLSLRQQVRPAATAASPAPATNPLTTPTKSAPSKSSPPKPQQSYRVLTSVVVSRPPLLTRPLTAFEKAYHLYNRRLNERLALPFTRYFYYRKGTPSDGEWKRKVRARTTAARDIGNYSGYGRDAWNDEVLVGSNVGTWEDTVNQVIRDAEEFREDNLRLSGHAGAALGKVEPETSQESGVGRDRTESLQPRDEANADELKGQQVAAAEEQGYEMSASTVKKEAVPRPLPRESGADAENNTKSLSRKMDRTLYLLVKNAAGRWVFPADLVRGKEGLHEAAERVLVQAGGINMNTWVVGNAPIGHYQYTFQKSIADKDRNIEELGEKTFFMKARIMTGQADISKNLLGDTDFCWLAKEEIESVVGPRYWASIKNMLVER